MYICICNAITEREVRGAVSLGCKSIRDLKSDLGVATCCGKCEPEARRVLRECRAASVASSCAGD
jgi:bacterioferritin-associated ferredoxin